MSPKDEALKTAVLVLKAMGCPIVMKNNMVDSSNPDFIDLWARAGAWGLDTVAILRGANRDFGDVLSVIAADAINADAVTLAKNVLAKYPRGQHAKGGAQ